MAKNNRDEAIIVTTAALVPTLTLAQHEVMLNDNVLNSVVFEKDVIASETPAAGAVTIDYEDKDTATVTTAVDLAVSFTNLENGAVKYLEVTKAAANVISFVGAVDKVNFRDYINTVETVVCYRISNKNGVIYAEALFAPDSTTWQNLTLATGWTGSAKYRINYVTDKIEFEFDVTRDSAINNIVCSIPSNINPDRNLYYACCEYSGSIKNASLGYSLSQFLIDSSIGEHYFGFFQYNKVLL